MLHQMLVYGDSLSWGIIPNTRQRLPFHARWPGVMENALASAGTPVRIIEDCLNGRRTVWEDPFKPGRNGLAGIEQGIEVNSPLSMVIFMLGTNDFQSMHPHNAWQSAQGLRAVLQAIRRAPLEPGMPSPGLVVVAPPPILEPKGPIAPKFQDATSKCAGQAGEYQRVALEEGAAFFDASSVVQSSVVDGVHLDANHHSVLGRALAGFVKTLLKEE
jgi:lysophospholipase L1-like esterase